MQSSTALLTGSGSGGQRVSINSIARSKTDLSQEPRYRISRSSLFYHSSSGAPRSDLSCDVEFPLPNSSKSCQPLLQPTSKLQNPPSPCSSKSFPGALEPTSSRLSSGLLQAPVSSRSCSEATESSGECNVASENGRFEGIASDAELRTNATTDGVRGRRACSGEEGRSVLRKQ